MAIKDLIFNITIPAVNADLVEEAFLADYSPTISVFNPETQAEEDVPNPTSPDDHVTNKAFLLIKEFTKRYVHQKDESAFSQALQMKKRSIDDIPKM